MTKPRTPQTNGMVERFNGRISDVLQSHHFVNGEDLAQTLYRYVLLYNQQLPQSTLRSKTPLDAMQRWYASHPHLFVKRPSILREVTPPEERRIIYTTNAIESVNARLRKILKTRGHFPNDEAATKLIWLALRNITKDWSRATPHWKAAMNPFAIIYQERFTQEDKLA